MTHAPATDLAVEPPAGDAPSRDAVSPRWLTAEEMRAWLGLQTVIALLPSALDAQLRRDSNLSHYEYLLLAMLSEAPERTLRMSALATATDATLPRLSHVVNRLERRGLVERSPDPTDRRATLARLTEAGWATVVAAAPGHVETVRQHVFDLLSEDQVAQLAEIVAVLSQDLDPTNRIGPPHERLED